MTDTRLLLIMPPQAGLLNGFAAGLVSLANFVRARMPNVRVDVLDLSILSSHEARAEVIHSLGPLQEEVVLAGITTTTASYQSALQIARFVKEADPRVLCVLGGHHVSADPETVLRSHPEIVDLVIIGEGERSLCELLRQYPALESVPGLAYPDRNGHIKHTKPPDPLTQDELDSIPVTFANNGLIGTPGKFDHATYVSARGCPLPCAFCAVGNDRIRTKSIDAVTRDVETLLDMGFSRIAIEDNFFAHSPSRTREICEALADIKRRRNGGFAWDCQTRVESLARSDTIDLMAKAGCEAVYIGIESMHPEQLAYLAKTKDPSKYLWSLIEVVVPALMETSIECYLNLQFGIPGETENHDLVTSRSLSALGKLALAHGKRITIFPQLHVVYPGTVHYRQGVEQGRFPADIFELFTTWEFNQPRVLNWLGEYFAHGTGGIPEGILNPFVLRDGDFMRDGGFEHVDNVVNSEAVIRISTALHRIDRISGISTFNYTKYIVSGNEPANGMPSFQGEHG